MARRSAAKPRRAPTPHASGARPPALPAEFVPRHVALVMDGNGRWAKQRGLPRTAGHEAGEASLFDCVEGAIELGITWLSAYAFSTENWKRSPEEVKFLMGFNRDVIRRRRDEMNELGVRVRWAGRRPRLWRSVINELEEAEGLTERNTTLTLTMCVNYGGRAEIADAAAAMARDAQAGRLDPAKIDERMFHRYLDEPDMPDVDLFVRSLGRAAHEQLPAVAVGLCRAGVHGHALAGLRPSPSVARVRDVRVTGPPLRRRRPQSGGDVVPTPVDLEVGAGIRRQDARQPQDRAGLRLQGLHSPEISMVWLTSTKPCSAATRSAHDSASGPAISTVVPHLRQTRWWWCSELHWR